MIDRLYGAGGKWAAAERAAQVRGGHAGWRGGRRGVRGRGVGRVVIGGAGVKGRRGPSGVTGRGAGADGLLELFEVDGLGEVGEEAGVLGLLDVRFHAEPGEG